MAALILKGRDRKLNPHYAALASHYRFAPMFCLPEKGQEKSDVERTVFALERRFATPVPMARAAVTSPVAGIAPRTRFSHNTAVMTGRARGSFSAPRLPGRRGVLLF